MAKKPIKVTEVVLRDAHQSLLATRMTMDEMRPILPEMDKINYFSVECWGGATFDSCIRFLDEDPWERLRILRKELPHQKLQMLFRGQNMLGYRPYADDAVEYFVQKSCCKRHRCHPHFRCTERSAQPADRHQGSQQGRRSCAGLHQLHPEPRAQQRVLCSLRQDPGGDGRKLHLHQGYGRSADPLYLL